MRVPEKTRYMETSNMGFSGEVGRTLYDQEVKKNKTLFGIVGSSDESSEERSNEMDFGTKSVVLHVTSLTSLSSYYYPSY